MQFLQHEHETRQRRIERRPEARARARAHQRAPLAVPDLNLEKFRHHLPDARAHLHRRALPPERETAARTEQSAQKLHGQHSFPFRIRLAQQDRLQLRDAAAGRMRRKSSHQPHADASAHRADGERHRQAPVPGVGNRGIAPALGMLKRHAKGRRQQTGQCTHQNRLADNMPAFHLPGAQAGTVVNRRMHRVI
ncbi:MAG: hypothetical protein WDM96_12990 [Lacunisphaera sp.]